MADFIVIVAWLLFAVWGHNVMESKNRSGVVGALLGAFLGIIGVIICYCHSDKPVV